MRRLLVLYQHDFDRVPNARVHHLVAHLVARWGQVTLVHGTQAEAGPLGASLARALAPRLTRRRSGNLEVVRVRPLLGTPDNLAKRVTGYAGGLPGRFRGLRGRAEAVLNALGVARDLGELASFRWALRRLGSGPFDVCVAQLPLAGLAGLGLRRRGGVGALVYDDIDFAAGFHDHRLRRAWMDRLERRVVRSADAVVSVGDLLGGLRTAQRGRPVTVIPNGVEADRFTPGVRSVRRPPTLIYMGRVGEWVGLPMAYGALARLRERVPDLRFLIVGGSDPPYRRQLDGLAAQLGLTDRIRWLGEVPYGRLPEILRGCDVGYAAFQPLLWRRYAFPLKVLEYMAAGLPVLGTAETETERILAAHDCGAAVAFEEEAMAAGLLRLLEDRRAGGRLAANALRGSRAYAWPDLLARMDGVIAGALGRPGGSGGVDAA